MYILDECFKYSDYQFGFIEGRGTSTAVALAHDVMAYCNYNNSSVFMSSLDTEGAFDGIPHPVLFSKTINIIPDACWRLLYRWYSNINVRIKWDKLGKSINIQKGTRQGGLTSPFLFNVFYKEFVDILSAHSGGISIYNKQFNLFCYADNLLIVSLTVTGLQYMINSAVRYVAQYGLRFNPTKTECVINGRNPFVTEPKFYIDAKELCLKNNITYLGATLGNKCNDEHINRRVSACRKAFYSLQAAGSCSKGLDIQTSIYVWNATCKSLLLYSCESLYLNSKNLHVLNKLQGKLIKCIVGIGARYHTSSLLQALRVENISNVI